VEVISGKQSLLKVRKANFVLAFISPTENVVIGRNGGVGAASAFQAGRTPNKQRLF
jgi:hypothetical protein